MRYLSPPFEGGEHRRFVEALISHISALDGAALDPV